MLGFESVLWLIFMSSDNVAVQAGVTVTAPGEGNNIGLEPSKGALLKKIE